MGESSSTYMQDYTQSSHDHASKQSFLARSLTGKSQSIIVGDIDTTQVHIRELETSSEYLNRSYGIMFDVHALETLVIHTIEFNADLTQNVNVKVWTKKGSFRGSETNPADWEGVALASVLGQGQGKTTPIPMENFHPVTIDGGTTQAFYLTLDHPNLRYSFWNKKSDVVASTPHIECLVGAGVGEKIFSDFDVAKAFDGSFTYSLVEDTTTVAFVTTETQVETPESQRDTQSVPFLLEIHYPPEHTLQTILPIFVSSVINNAKTAIFKKNNDPKNECKVAFISVSCGPNEQPDCKPAVGEAICELIDMNMTIAHRECKSAGEVTFQVLKTIQEVSHKFHCPGCLQVLLGPDPQSSKLTLKLNGNNLMTIDGTDKDFFEGTTLEFFEETTSQFNFLTATVDRQDIAPRFQSRHLRLGSDSLYVEMTITGEYMPPPDVDFGLVVEDSIDHNQHFFLSKIHQNENFRNIKGVEKSSPSSGTFSKPTTNNVIQTPAPIQIQRGRFFKENVEFFYVCGFILIAGVLACSTFCYIFYTRRSKNDGKWATTKKS